MVSKVFNCRYLFKCTSTYNMRQATFKMNDKDKRNRKINMVAKEQNTKRDDDAHYLGVF